MVQQWGRFIWWLGQNFVAVVEMLLTAVLAYFNYRYIKLTSELARSAREQSDSAGRQLRLLAHPNPVVKVTIDRQKRSVCVEITNRGAYPFRLENAEIAANDDEGSPFTKKLHEVCGGLVGSNDNARTYAFLRDEKIDLGSGAFEDWLRVEFDCEDVIGLAKKRYSHTKVSGLREISQ